MKKIISIFIAGIIITLVGCAGDSNGHEGEAKTPSGSSTQKGRDYQEVVNDFKEKGFKNIRTEKREDLVTGWLTKDGEVESVSVEGDKDYLADVWYSNDVEVVITYHTFPKEEKSETESTDENSSETDEQSNNDTSAESNQKILTVKNNEDLAAILAVKDENDPIIGEFAKKYGGRTIEFDGYIAHMVQHEDYTTRYNILIYAGDYSETTFSGPIFKFEDVNILDLNLTGPEIPENIGMEQNLHITAVVEEYNETSGLFFIKPISTKIR